ncbi:MULTISPECIES: TolC family protein [Dictyoglomus]|uniref:Outer membrane efflux protein n=1 Tax=Dictyoglomus turgidum (strain DSM 6724 / Z-1310) TaxID=515635 RepID=B8E035_DICTD|nr:MULTISPECIES: TolC family protein [Dictyoglomus]ACK42118.1 outer membrane efflux protein [Dictyoglomus turgidum DSM 6724]HBU32349.1 TolC family protein [Dictyoglomus sp.]
MRRLFIIFVSFVLLLSISFSQEAKVLSLEEAIDIALKNNGDLLVAKINLDNAFVDYENKKKDPTTLILALKQAELNLSLEKVRYENTKLQVIQNVRNAYFNVLEAQTQVKLYEKQLAYYEETFNATKAKYQVGNATATDVSQAELNYLSAVNSLKTAQNNLTIYWSQFWQTLGISPIEKVVLREPEMKVYNFNLDDLFNIAKENLSSLVQAKNNVELYELQVKLCDNDYTPKATLISAMNSLESAKKSYEQTLNSTKITIAQRLEQLNASLKDIEVQQKNLDLAKENYKIIQLKLDAGLVTKLDLMNAEINVIKAENNYYSSLHNYWKSLDSLSLAVGKALY